LDQCFSYTTKIFIKAITDIVTIQQYLVIYN